MSTLAALDIGNVIRKDHQASKRALILRRPIVGTIPQSIAITYPFLSPYTISGRLWRTLMLLSTANKRIRINYESLESIDPSNLIRHSTLTWRLRWWWQFQQCCSAGCGTHPYFDRLLHRQCS
jgi:hypothetical protein